MSTEIRPNSFGTFEKQAPGYEWVTICIQILTKTHGHSQVRKTKNEVNNIRQMNTNVNEIKPFFLEHLMKEENNLSRVLLRWTIWGYWNFPPEHVITIFGWRHGIPENSCYQTSSATEAISDEEKRAHGNHSGCYPSFSIISTKSVRSWLKKFIH